MSRANVLRFILLGCIWGASYTFIKISLEGLTPGQLVLTRLVLGAAVLVMVARLRGVRLPRLSAAWGHVVVTAALGLVLPFLLLAFGERSTSAAVTGLLIGATPLLTMLAATAVVHTERATSRKAAGLLVGFAGVVLVVAPWGSDPGSLLGQLAILGAAASYAGQTVYVRRFLSSSGWQPLALAAAQVLVATVLVAAASPLLAWEAPSLSRSVVTSIVLLGVFGTGTGYVLYYRLIGDAGATTASAVNYLIPVIGVVISVAALGEPVTWNMVAGAALALSGIALAERRVAWRALLRARRRHPVPSPVPTDADA